MKPFPFILSFSAATFCALAMANQTEHVGGAVTPPSKGSEDLTKIENFARLPPDPAVEAEPERPTEESVSALMLSLWSISAGKTPAPELISAAGLSESGVKKFMRDLKPSEKLSPADRLVLRKSYNRDEFGARLAARSKFIAFVSKFQERFPSTAMVLPELLTVWGEARNIRGFDELSSFNQQAKMATIIHVIRNRSERRTATAPGRLPHQNKWNVVTRRFQFSAFEPYDPNLAEIALGPMSATPFGDLNSLPRADQIALRNLAKIIASMNRGDVLLSKPLVYNNTFHYLTPSLFEFNKENVASLKSQIERTGRRLKLIHIPERNPQYIAAVPNWSRQSALISHPPVKIKDAVKQNFQTQVVSPTDFIYFRGIR